MGRKKLFNREQVLARAMPVFWRNGYAHTTVQDLEAATGVNKSGLYGEFSGKEDLFLASLQYYMAHRGGAERLSRQPLGWDNVQHFLELGLTRPDEQRGCFVVNSLREVAVLPGEAASLLTASRARLTALLEQNLAAEKTLLAPPALALLVLTFYTGLCMEQNVAATVEEGAARIAAIMAVLRAA
jgi:TetR/AcrR family transcriptional regulator, copper-responsive repressor